MFKTIKWNTGSAATRFRLNKKKEKKNKAASSQARKRVGPPLKSQAASRLTVYKL
jgi:hypothetical protein